MSEQKQIAEDAVFQVAVAVQYLDWISSVLEVLRDRLDEQATNTPYAKLAEMAVHNAERWSGELDADRESLEIRSEQAFGQPSAPQNASLPIRGAEVEGGQ